jgi:TonB-linked SusC/RagA family outer membrane protein
MKKYIFSIMMLLVSLTMAAQENAKTLSDQKSENFKTVKGQVIDAATQKPLAGVIVAAYGNDKYSAMTDEQGRYTLYIPNYVSSVQMRIDGYNLMQSAIADGEANGQLYHEAFSDVYKSQTIAIQSSEANRFANSSEVSIDPLIAQQLGADVRSVSRGGNVGLGNTLLMAGINSINSNAQPLIVIDDVIMDMEYNRSTLHEGYFNNMLANLNVNDIESVQVLKNGTALYGAKGSNGVLIIKTKRNKSMATKIDVTINGRFNAIPRLPEMMGAEDYRLYTTELLANKTMNMGQFKYLNSAPTYFYYNQYHNNTDWKDEVYKNSFSQNYGINVQGGDDIASYNLSVGYSLANSTLKKNDYTRFNMRLNTDINIAKGFNVRFDASYSDVDRSLFDDGAPSEVLSGVITSPGFIGLTKAPFLSPYAFDNSGNPSHYLAEADDYLEGMFKGRGRLANPTSILANGEGDNRNSLGNRLIVFAVTPKYEINKHLTVSEHFALTLVNTNENYYLPIKGVPTFVVDGLDENTTLNNIVQSQASSLTALQSDTRLAWKNQYGAHQVGVMGGFRYLNSAFKLTSQSGYNTPNDKAPKMSSSLNFKNTDGANDKTTDLVWYALADYNYAQRYYVNAGLSAHASSRFGNDADGLKLGGVVWGLFPSIEGAWVATNESWFPKTNLLNYLRLSVGFDVTGNDDVDYTASRSYFVSRRMFNSSVTGVVIGNIGNTELKWETTKRLTAGIEGNFLNNRLNVRFNYFKSWTNDLLSLRQLAWTSGLDASWSNDGKLENHGFDVHVIGKILNMKDFRWELGASIGHYKNEVTALPDNNRSIETGVLGATIQTKVGQPVGVFYGYKTNGVYSTTAEALADGKYIVKENGEKLYFEGGDMNFVDITPDGIIDEKDRTVIGDPNPDIYGNIHTTFSWKNLTLSAVFNYSVGNDIYNYQRSLLEGGTYFLNQTTAMNSRWTTENQQTNIPRVSYGDPLGNSRFSDRWIEDGSYLRMSNLTISYYLPIQSTYLQGITIFGNVNNLFTITKYLGSDPDCAISGGILTQGIDRGLLGQGRSFSLGVNINL